MMRSEIMERATMEYARIELEQRESVERIRKRAGYVLLSHSFNTLFLWQDTLQLSIFLEEDFFVVRYGLVGENCYFCPCGDEEKTRQWLLSVHQESGFRLFYVDEARKLWLAEQYPDIFRFHYDAGSCEYIFDRQRHLLMQGRSYQRMRYEIHHLAAGHQLRTEVLTQENLSVSRQVIEAWRVNNCEKKTGLITEDILVARCALQYFDALNLRGVLVYVDEKPMATAIGCEITEDTYGIQIAKMSEKIEGLMFYLLEQMFDLIPGQYRYVNGDDDMDIEGIRIHKQKMKPVRMNEVWQVFSAEQ